MRKRWHVMTICPVDNTQYTFDITEDGAWIARVIRFPDGRIMTTRGSLTRDQRLEVETILSK